MKELKLNLLRTTVASVICFTAICAVIGFTDLLRFIAGVTR